MTAKDPPQPQPLLPIVALGAAEGGQDALETFFTHWPAGCLPAMAFILVSPQPAGPVGPLAEAITRCTAMRVCEAKHGMTLKPNCVFIVPPHPLPALRQGRFSLQKTAPPAGPWLPVDCLFRSLALERGSRAIGIVLSGAGGDGALGARAIKEEGGMVMAQKPETAAFGDMPRSVAATQQVDYLLAPAEMPARILAYATQAFGPPSLPMAAQPRRGVELDRLMMVLRHQTGHDFSGYRRSTIQQRVARRMAVAQVPTLARYVKHLQQTPAEAEALLLDLLVGVSHFFRDPDAFRSLEKHVIPALGAGRPGQSPIRVWAPGCSTGEEAYTLAMLLAEAQERTGRPGAEVKIFATDIDGQAIQRARAGQYPASIAADLTPERLARWFTPEPGGNGYRVGRAIRDLVTFSEHDLLRDPPFSRLDLISCRNLLTHMSEDLQKRLILTFHYALNPGGRLLLGATETVGEAGGLFAEVDPKARIYECRAATSRSKRAGPGHPSALPRWSREPWLPGPAGNRDFSHEDLQVFQQDLHSANEELVSTLEEVQTSHAELLSSNQELQSLNAELETRVADLTRTQAELDDFLAGPGIGVIYLDTALRILRFTPAARRQVNLIPADVGRPLAHLSTNLAGYDQLVADARAVVTTMRPLQEEVSLRTGEPFLLRLQPYLSLTGLLLGVVIVFLDVTATAPGTGAPPPQPASGRGLKPV